MTGDVELLKSVPLTRRRFTVEEYYRMGAAGIFAEDDRVELLDGEIVEMGAIGSAHAGHVNALNRIFTARVGGRALVTVQNPLRLGTYSEPLPDIALLRPRADDYRNSHPQPGDVLLIVEVADTTVETDRRLKSVLYARAAIPELWLVNLPEKVVEVYRRPTPYGYEDVSRRFPGDVLTIETLPAVEVRVEEIFGEARR